MNVNVFIALIAVIIALLAGLTFAVVSQFAPTQADHEAAKQRVIAINAAEIRQCRDEGGTAVIRFGKLNDGTQYQQFDRCHLPPTRGKP